MEVVLGMNDCLLIMNARKIPECISAFEALDIDKVWFKAFTEQGLEAPIVKFISESSYDNYIIASDDLVPNQLALDVVRKGLEKHEVFTGWCDMSPDNWRGSVRLSPFVGNYAFFVITHAITQLHAITYGLRLNSFPPCEEVENIKGEFRTYFASLTYTGMRKSLWERFPFMVYHPPWNKNPLQGFGSDFMLSQRLNKAKIPIMCDSKAFVYHLASHKPEEMIVGKMPPQVVYEPKGSLYSANDAEALQYLQGVLKLGNA